MDHSRIAELLQPFVQRPARPDTLESLSLYLELLLKWNLRVNLTAVRDPEQIVTRHFGESLFAAELLSRDDEDNSFAVADVGSGAGFPGVPMKLWVPSAQLTLIESQNKKATFLRELIRALSLEKAEVFSGRAEDWRKTADVVTLRAVEKFERTLPIAAKLVASGGRLGLLIGEKQLDLARTVLGDAWTWRDPVAIPLSDGRVVAIAAPKP